MSETKSAVVPYSNDPMAVYLQESLFNQMQRAARLMASSRLVPKHLQGSTEQAFADCFLVCQQAYQWNLNPFAVAQSTYVLSGKLGYEGKLIAGVLNSSPRLERKLNYEYFGDSGTPKRGIRVFGTLKGEETPREVTGTVAAWQTSNDQWRKNTDQMLAYRGAREWARRHMPEVILGINSEDELEAIVATATQAPTVVEPESISEVLGEVLTAADDPQKRGPQAPVVDAVTVPVEPKPEPVALAKPAPKPEPKKPEPKPVAKADPKKLKEDAAVEKVQQELRDLFGV